MAGRGPIPSSKSANSHVKPLRAVPGASDHPIPAGDWLPETRAWWKRWVESEQAASFTSTAWGRLDMLVHLVEMFYQNPSRSLMAEIRQNESLLGAAPADQQRLRWKPSPPEPPKVTGLYDHLKGENLD